MRIKGLLMLGLGLALSFTFNQQVFAASQNGLAQQTELLGGGGDKEKKEKAGKEEKDKSMKDAKTSNASSKPSKHARTSAKEAKYSAKFAQKQIIARAKVRNFFHNMFNTKYGKSVNFRSRNRRNRWSKGR